MLRQKLIENRTLQLTVWGILAIFVYGMGLFMIVEPSTRSESLQMTPVVLLLTTGLLLFFAETPYTWRMAAVFAVITVAGFLAELAGVQTGRIFGQYEYTANFGVLWWNTPPLIGINWLFLSYSWASVTKNTESAPFHRILYAALGMLAYDLLLEQAAIPMQLWRWADGRVPPENYVAWFVLALLFQALIRRSRINTANRIALPLLILQILMFTGVILLADQPGQEIINETPGL